MKEKIPKIKFLFDEEDTDEEYLEEIDQTEKESLREEEEELLSEKGKAKEEIKMKRLMRRIEQTEKKEAKKVQKEEIESTLLKVLSKGKVVSKYNLSKLLIQYGIKNYSFRLNLLENSIQYEIPNIGNVLKSLRFQKKILFSIHNGSHVYYINKKQKVLKPKEKRYSFNFYDYKIPEGEHEIYLIFKIPGSNISTRHFLTSCYPNAEFKGFSLVVKSDYEKSGAFYVIKDQLNGYIESDKLVLRCKTTDSTVAKTLFTLIKIGRKIVKEIIMLNLKESEVLKVLNKKNKVFIPVIPIFRPLKSKIFFNTKYTNALRIIYDFPQKFDGKEVYGKYSLIVQEKDDSKFDLNKYNDFMNNAFEFLIKSFISNAILKDWIINPRKAYNYMEPDKEIDYLIEEYIQDIDTDRIIQEKLESSLEKSEFIKDMTTNLLLTLLGLSVLTQNPVLQWIIIGAFVVINLYFLISKSRRSRKIFKP
jgi:hypothetical protein